VLDDAGRVGAARRNAGCLAERRSLEPAERHGVALAEVLRRIEHHGHAACAAAQGTQQEDLGGREGERLLVEVQDVPVFAERSPDRTRVVNEEGGVVTNRSDADHVLALARVEGHRRAARVPALGAQQGDVDAEGRERAFATPPLVDNGAV